MKYKTRRNTQLPKKETLEQPVIMSGDLCQKQQQEQREENMPETFDLESGIGFYHPGAWLESMAKPQIEDDELDVADDVEDILDELDEVY